MESTTIPSCFVEPVLDPRGNELQRLRVCTYNIVSGGGNRLNMALRAMALMRVDLGLFMETKLSHDKYTTDCCGYQVVASRAKSNTQGGVALFYRTSKIWTIEGVRTYGPNVLSCTLVSGQDRWSIIGMYIPPSEDDGSTLSFYHEAIRNARHNLIFLGDINVDLRQVDDDRSEDIATALTLVGLQDVSDHFTHPRGRWTWSQRRQNRYVRTVTDCILAESPEEFSRWAVKIPRYDSDHRALIAELQLHHAHMHSRYVRQRRHFPVVLSRPLTYADQLLEDLKVHRKTLDPQRQRDHSWISFQTWQVIDRRVSLRRLVLFSSRPPFCGEKRSWSFANEQDISCLDREIHKLGREKRRLLRRDRRRRANGVSLLACSYLEAGDIASAYNVIRGWYRKRNGYISKPTIHDLDRISKEYSSLYSTVPLFNDPLPINVKPTKVPDGPPTEDEILKAVRHLKRGKQPGASAIRVEDILCWHETLPNVWAKVIELVQLALTGQEIPLAFAIGILCLIPKQEPNKFRGIVLLEVIHKICTTIIHFRVQGSITFHSGIHGFRIGRGTITAILEAKLQMQHASRSGLPYYQVFLDLRKAYDTLDRDRTMAILEAYGVGPNIRNYLRWIWNNLVLVPKSGGYFGSPIRSRRGILQGDCFSTDSFTIIVDCVLREWYRQIGTNDLISIFFADDGRIAGYDPLLLQAGLDLLIALFARVGLQPNAEKTKAMISLGGIPNGPMSSTAYKRRYDYSLPTYRLRKARKVACELCNTTMTAQYLPCHLRDIHGISTPTVAMPFSDPATSTLYSISYPSGVYGISCPVAGCPAMPVDRERMRDHFCRRHPSDTIHIVEEGLLPQCPNCRKFLHSINDSHLASRSCRQQTIRFNERNMATTRQAIASQVSFSVEGIPIENISEYKYLGRVLENSDLDHKAVTLNLKNARERWGGMVRLFTADGARSRTLARFYLAVVQAVLLHGSETWVLTQRQRRRLDTFHHRSARFIANEHIRQLPNGEWITPHSDDILERCGLSPISTYIAKSKTRLLHNYAEPFSLTYRQCLASVPVVNSRRRLVWWEP